MLEGRSLYFIHIPKTAGTYVHHVLNDALGKDYVREGHTVPEHYMRPWTERFGPSHFQSVKQKNCITFTVVRNPFDLLVSMYSAGFPYWPPKHAGHANQINWPFKSFRDYVEKLCKWDDYPWIVPEQRKSLFFQIFDEGEKPIPHVIIRQERLSGGLFALLNSVGHDQRLPPARVNETASRGGKSYVDFYDSELRRIVEKRYERDLDLFGYSFGGDDMRPVVRITGQPAYDGIVEFAPSKMAEQNIKNSTLADSNLHRIGGEVISTIPVADIISGLGRKMANRFS